MLAASEFRTRLQELLVLLPTTPLDHGDDSHSYTEDDHTADVNDVEMEFTDDRELDEDVYGAAGDLAEEQEGTRQDADVEPTSALKKRSHIEG